MTISILLYLQVNQEYESITFILGIVALVSTFIGLILSILFFVWGRDEQKSASELHSKTIIKNNEILSGINEKIKIIHSSEEQTRDILIRNLLEINNYLIQNKLKESLSNEIQKLIPSNGNIANVDPAELQDKINSVVNIDNIKIISDQSMQMMYDIGKTLNQLDRKTITILYLIWNYEYTNEKCSFENLQRESMLSETEIRDCYDKLIRLNVLTQEKIINPKIYDILTSFFEIEDYSGMRLSEKINAIEELVIRIVRELK